MNLYFLVEGRRTESKIYPKWLSHLLPLYSRVSSPDQAKDNNYYLLDGRGYPSLFNFIEDAVTEINDLGNFDYFFICFDAEELEVEEQIEIVRTFFRENELVLHSCESRIIIQNKCIETWLLGNRRVFPRQPEGERFRQYAKFYNVEEEDPELMGIFPGFQNHAGFHESYLKEMLKERNERYSKRSPGTVQDQAYLEQLIHRADGEERHLASFKYFIDQLREIRAH